jgi:hypothetical protein
MPLSFRLLLVEPAVGEAVREPNYVTATVLPCVTFLIGVSLPINAQIRSCYFRTPFLHFKLTQSVL